MALPDAIRCSNPILIRERKMKTTLKYHLCPVRLAKLQGFNNEIGEVGEKLALPCFVDEIKCPEEAMCPLSVFHKHLYFDPSIPCQEIFLRESLAENMEWHINKTIQFVCDRKLENNPCPVPRACLKQTPTYPHNGEKFKGRERL